MVTHIIDFFFLIVILYEREKALFRAAGVRNGGNIV